VGIPEQLKRSCSFVNTSVFSSNIPFDKNTPGWAFTQPDTFFANRSLFVNFLLLYQRKSSGRNNLDPLTP